MLMNFCKSAILITACVFLPVSLFSQASGYLGKKLVLTADLLGSPILWNYSINKSYNLKESGIRFNRSYSLNLEYVIGQNMSLGINADQIRTGTHSDISETRVFNQTVLEEGDVRIKGVAFGPYLNFYNYTQSGATAPVGMHFHLGINLLNYNGIYADPNYLIQNGNVTDTVYTDTIIYRSRSDFAIKFGLNVNRIIKDRIVLKFGVHSGMTSKFFENNDYSSNDLEARIRVTLTDRIRRFYILGFRIGVGFLII